MAFVHTFIGRDSVSMRRRKKHAKRPDQAHQVSNLPNKINLQMYQLHYNRQTSIKTLSSLWLEHCTEEKMLEKLGVWIYEFVKLELKIHHQVTEKRILMNFSFQVPVCN